MYTNTSDSQMHVIYNLHLKPASVKLMPRPPVRVTVSVVVTEQVIFTGLLVFGNLEGLIN